MKNFAIFIYIFFFIISFGCSKSSLEKIDLEQMKIDATEKKEDIEKIKEKIKKIKKKM